MACEHHAYFALLRYMRDGPVFPCEECGQRYRFGNFRPGESLTFRADDRPRCGCRPMPLVHPPSWSRPVSTPPRWTSSIRCLEDGTLLPPFRARSADVSEAQCTWCGAIYYEDTATSNGP